MEASRAKQYIINKYETSKENVASWIEQEIFFFYNATAGSHFMNGAYNKRMMI